MSEYDLIVLAGCNGSGKSTWSKELLPKTVFSFDADKRKKEIYDAFGFDFELRERMAWNQTQEEFKSKVAQAIKNKKDFAYETNFNHTPLYWARKFKRSNYKTHLIFFSLKSIKLAIERVAIRFQEGGHYVPNDQIRQRYTDGFRNLNRYYKNFDSITILESSIDNKMPTTIFSNRGNKIIKRRLPGYLKKNCVDLSLFIVNS